MSYAADAVRSAFPSLAVADDGAPRIYLDNPAGTQVPQRVADAAARALIESNANLGGFFRTSIAAETVIERARVAMGDLLGAASPREIVVGPSMTALTFRIARALARTWQPGDEIVVTRMDHDGNVAPWLTVAQERGLVVRVLPFDTSSWQLEPDALAALLTDRTRLVALNYASNLTGSINDVAALVARAKAAGALTYVDAVQFTPHGFVDVEKLGCDFLACSSYKFFGPHLGIVWGREALLDTLHPDKVRPSTEELPWRFELGTPQIELFAALEASVDHLAWIGELHGEHGARRERLRRGFAASVAHEAELAQRLIDGLREIDGVRIVGIADPNRVAQRVPTVSFVHERVAPDPIAQALARENIFVWSGHNYALEIVRQLGIDEATGVVRIGAAHYTIPAEIDATVAAVRRALA